MCYIFNKNITHFLKYVNRYYDLIYEYTLYNWSSTFLVNSRKETPGLVSVRNVRYGPELWEKSANSHKRTLVAYRTKKSKIFLAKKRINCLPVGGECAIITESRLRHDMRWSGRLRLVQPVFPWSMSDFKPGDKNMRGTRSRAFGLLLTKGAPCRDLRRRNTGLGYDLTASQTFFICPHPDSVKTESGF